MSKHFAVGFTIFVLTLAAGAQNFRNSGASDESVAPSWQPHPILFGGPSLMSGGYQPLSLSVGGGFLINSDNLVGDVEGSYENARKTNDGTVDNLSGHERHLEGRFFYRYSTGLFFGPGAQWSETSTTNYTKSAWRPTFGVGGDHFGDGYNMRWQAVYVMPGTDHLNALQGPEIQVWLPSPTSHSHFFYRQTLGIYEFHATITDPSNPVLTAQQKSSRNAATFLDFTVGWRF